ncbi:MAG: Ni/Fe hydrogenase subunit alpha [Nitrospinae bacterium CG11_big_fil_rev_8_21_14_0_20_45_15]|nr:MAG: Ni/Fe hydrogenase subunit alpha [Nitrospinae bacterium CG11_big_fil_rev_8_21_14_0_20_45_15]
MKKKTRTIKVDYLARVEGEGGLHIKVKNDEVVDVKLKIFEPPRFFEAFLRGRDYKEAPDITARICGICPVAYQMSTVHAMENAFGVQLDRPLRDLRRLLYCGEWIESHTLHIYMLHAPDFLGYPDAIQMAKDHREIVERGLKLKKAGNAIVSMLGGREIHPINVRVGGFYKLFSRQEFEPLIETLKWARDAALETVRWTSQLTFPEFEQDYEFVALRHPDEYPFNEGNIVSNKGLDINCSEYEDHFEEQHVEHSNALHSILKKRGAYFVGPMARYNLNFDRLSPLAQESALQSGLGKECRNPFKSISIRSIEVLYACDEALRILEAYEKPEQPFVTVEPREGIGYSCTEAPRGILYHHYRLDEKGIILEAKIVPPTSQNQKTIENDLKEFVPKYINLSKEELTWQCEQAVRNYDPCISCATHFLKLDIVHS